MARNPRRTDWDFFIGHLTSNIAHREVGSYIRNELELEGVGRVLDKQNVREWANRSADRYKLYCREHYLRMSTGHGTVTNDYEYGSW